MAIIPIPPAQEEPTFKKQCPWAPMLPMPGACTICTGMFMSGAAIGMGIIQNLNISTPMDLLREPLKLFAVVFGVVMENIAVQLIAIRALHPTEAITSAFVWSARVDSGNHSDLYPPKVVARATCPEGRGSITF